MTVGHLQNPAIYDEVRGDDFYLVLAPPEPGPAPAAGRAGPRRRLRPAPARLRVLGRHQGQPRSRDFQAYLDRFGEQGAFAPLAHRELAALQPAPETPLASGRRDEPTEVGQPRKAAEQGDATADQPRPDVCERARGGQGRGRGGGLVQEGRRAGQRPGAEQPRPMYASGRGWPRTRPRRWAGTGRPPSRATPRAKQPRPDVRERPHREKIESCTRARSQSQIRRSYPIAFALKQTGVSTNLPDHALSIDELKQLDLTGVDLSRRDFSNIQLPFVSLAKAFLDYSILDHADLSPR